MHCPRCGTAIPPGSAFCHQCGNAVTDPGSATVQIATAEEQDQLLVQLRRDLAADYEIERLLGRGGMAVVYKAIERELQRDVAIKVLPPGTTGEMAERFKREARLAAQLGHQNIIPVYRVGQAAGTHFFAMKFVEGRALDAIIEQQGALPIPVVLTVLRGAVAGLAFAHEKNVVHRDIKGANILVELDGHVLLSDMGIARAMEEKKLTATGSVIGTPHFMSPEQCSGQPVGPQSDQYSMGVLAFQMLTGQVPFDSETLMGILQHHFFSPVPDIAAVRGDVPEGLLAVVRRALAKEPGGRYPTTREMLRAIEAVPFGDTERAEAEAILRQLAVGTSVPKVRTGSLPPLPDTRTLQRPGADATSREATVRVAEPGKRPGTQAKRARRSRVPLVAGVVAVLVVGGGAGAWVVQQRRADRQAAADSARAAQQRRLATPPRAAPRPDAAAVPRPDSTAVVTGPPPETTAAARTPAARRPPDGRGARSSSAAQARGAPNAPGQQPRTTEPEPAATGEPGFLRVSASLPNADILVDGRRIGQGMVIGEELPAGRHRLRITAPGCTPHEEAFTITAGQTQNLGRKQLTCAP